MNIHFFVPLKVCTAMVMVSVGWRCGMEEGRMEQ